MNKTTEREVLLQDFGNALAALMGSALSDLTPGKARLLLNALENGTGTIQVIVNTDPFIIVGAVRWADRSQPPSVLFRIDACLPSGFMN